MRYKQRSLFIFGVILAGCLGFQFYNSYQHKFRILPEVIVNDEIFDFEGFDNENGTTSMIIPNIVHFLFLNNPNIKFYQMINIFAVYLNQKPAAIYLHCDNCLFTGKYWKQIISQKDVSSIVKIHELKSTTTIFGVKYGWTNHHRSDIYRLLILMRYGGIYLDTDSYVINSLDKYRKYEMVLEWQEYNTKDGIGNQVLIAHKNARLLKAHFDSYRYNYTPGSWFWNAGHMPAKILQTHRFLAHIVKDKFGTYMLIDKLFKKVWPEWKKLDAVHLLINHRWYLDKDSTVKNFDEENILKYNYTYGYMARDVMKRMNLKFN